MSTELNLGASEDRRGEQFCRSCSSINLFVGLDLGSSPIANRLPSHPHGEVEKFPLCMRICRDCGLGQIGEFESREEIFADYPYLSSTSKTWVEQNRQFADEISTYLGLGANDLVVELASNDGYLLREFQANGVKVLGVEPAKNVAKLAIDNGVETLPVFFGADLGEQIRSTHGAPRLVVAKNVLAHVPDINDFVAGISKLAGSQTLITIETPTILQIIEELQFDTIYHEHFSYLSATSLQSLLGRHGLRLVGLENVSSHGGSIRFLVVSYESKFQASESSLEALERQIRLEASSNYTSPEVWKDLAKRVRSCANNFVQWISHAAGDARVFGYGAPAKAVTFLSFADIPEGVIEFIVDNSPGKHGKYFPVNGIPIVSHSEAEDIVAGGRYIGLILPWNLAAELTPIAKFGGRVENIYRALPEVELLGD